MSRRAILDTSFLVGEVDRFDTHHPEALSLRAALEHFQSQVIYLDIIVAEAISVLARRYQERRRAEEFPSLLETLARQITPDRITWVGQEIRRYYPAILDDVRSTSGRRNFNDALLVVVARDADINAIVSFDADFDDVPGLLRLATPSSIEEWSVSAGEALI